MRIGELKSADCALRNLSNLNIIMGRNGSGKSRFLRSLDREFWDKDGFNVRYVSPERAGTFTRDGNIITHISSNPGYLRNVRSTNQVANFKAASAVLLREAETMYLRKLAATPSIRENLERNFQADRLDKINGLLTNISLEVGQSDFEFRALTGEPIQSGEISSGEAEAVSLATEIIYFFDTLVNDRFNVLLLDEPDVHLHPDLQARLAKMIVGMLEENSEQIDNVAVCISTHSAPFVCAVAASDYTSIGTKSFGVEEIDLKRAPDLLKRIGPFFAHPLSLMLSEDAALIVEGEDDERVWQQTVRSSNGRIKVFPVVAGSKGEQHQLEQLSVQLLSTLYDSPIAFSIRDGDGVIAQDLQHLLPLRRFRLECYSIENLLVSDQCMEVMGTSWEAFVPKAGKWKSENLNHKDALRLDQLVQAADRLRHEKVKVLRHLIPAIVGCKKPWELIVAQALAAIQTTDSSANSMLVDFVGEGAIKAVLFREF